MKSFIKLLSKLPSSVFLVIAFVLCVLVFYESVLFADLMRIYFEAGAIRVLLMFSIFILPTYGTYRLMKWTRKAIDQSIRDSNSDLIVDTDIPALCLDMLEAVQHKYRYTNYEEKLETFLDWMQFHLKEKKFTTLEEEVQWLPEKKLAKGVNVTYDNVLIAPNKLLDWLFHTNYLVVRFFSAGSAIEINLLSQTTEDGVDVFQLRIKITTKGMELRGQGEFAELRFKIEEDDRFKYEEIIIGHIPFLTYIEKEMEDSDAADVIKFMQKFIKNTRKLIRKV